MDVNAAPARIDRAGAVSIAGLVAVLVATLSFLPIVQGGRWWLTSLLFAGCAVAAAAGARRLGAAGGAAALVGLTTVPLVAVLLAGRGQGLLFVLPTREAALAVIATLEAGLQQIATDSTPAADTPALALLLGGGVAVAAVLVDAVAVALRAPLAAMLVVLALAIVPGRALNTGTNGWLLVAVALAVLLVVAADRRRRGAPSRLPGLLTGGAAALVLALGAQTVLPAPFAGQAQGAPLPPLFASGADTLLRLGSDLRRGADTSVLTYRTTAKDEVYLRLAVLEDFSGSTWSPTDADWFGLRSGSVPSAPGLDQDAVGESVTTTVTPLAATSIGERLPIPYPAQRVTGDVGDDFRWESQGLTLVRRSSQAIGRYTVTSSAVDTSAAALRDASTAVPPGDDASLTLPADIPAIVSRTAASWTRNADSPYAAALAIQNRLRDGTFLYDENTPAEQGYDGDGLGVIAKFLRVKAGYCIHYASTMAVMARIEGIPSRIVVGYQPGTSTTTGGQRTYEVSTDDLHAWPELYFERVGWVRFEPTPGRGAVPTYAPVPTSSASTETSTRPSAETLPSDEASTPAAAGGDDGGAALLALLATSLRVMGTMAAIALVLSVPAAVRWAIRRRRLLRLGRAGPAEIAWREIVDTGADLGHPVGDGSPRAVEAVLAARLGGSGPPAAALGRIRAAFERDAYGPASAESSAEDVRAVRAGLLGAAGRGPRLVAALAPRSLVARIAESRLAFRWSPPGSDRGTRAARLGTGHNR